MIPTCMRSLVVSFVLLVAGAAFAQDVGLRSFPVPEHGAFKLQVPKSWKDKVSPTAGSTAPTITFTGSGQEKFEMLLTPTWRTWPANPRAAAAEIWLLVQQNAERLKPKAVEKELSPQEISGASSAGYYISVTDPAPKPGEYKYLMQGTLRVGELLVRFTVLTNDGGDSIRRQALALVQSATHASEEASSSPAGAGTDRPDAIQITQTNTHYALTVPASRLVMQFPKGTFSPGDRDTGGQRAARDIFLSRIGICHSSFQVGLSLRKGSPESRISGPRRRRNGISNFRLRRMSPFPRTAVGRWSHMKFLCRISPTPMFELIGCKQGLGSICISR
jgi:hypothetical protein